MSTFLRAVLLTTTCCSLGLGQPTVSTDLGVVSYNGTTVAPARTLAPGQVLWYRFRINESLNQFQNWIDIDTSTSTMNTELQLYDARGNRLAEDFDSGGGASTGANGLAAAMSLGAGSGERLAGETGPNSGGRISDGEWIFALPPGEYFLSLQGADDQTSPLAINTWDRTSDSTLTGNAGITISSGRVARSYWNERFNGTDAGEIPTTALIPKGSGPLTKIVHAFGGGARDMFKIRICDPAQFSATVFLSELGGGRYQSRIFLFDELGRGVAAYNGTTANSNTRLSNIAGLQPGDYYLCVANNCGGAVAGIAATAFDSANNPIFDFSVSNVVVRPSGPGASNPVAYFGRQSLSGICDDQLRSRIELVGACYADDVRPACPADIGAAGGSIGSDGVLDNNDFVAFINLFFQGCP